MNHKESRMSLRNTRRKWEKNKHVKLAIPVIDRGSKSLFVICATPVPNETFILSELYDLHQYIPLGRGRWSCEVHIKQTANLDEVFQRLQTELASAVFYLDGRPWP